MITQIKEFVSSYQPKEPFIKAYMLYFSDMQTQDQTESILQDIVVIYHAHCQDGFGSAFAAYQKFGNTASYIACSDRVLPPEGLIGKEVYVLDFSYPKEVLLELEKNNRRLVVIDHHISAEEAVTAVKEHVFKSDHAASYLAWEYFTGSTVPPFIQMLEIIDLAKDKEGNEVDLITYILSKQYIFEAYRMLLEDFSTEEGLVRIRAAGHIQHEYLLLIIEAIISKPDFVVFEGYTVPCINMHLPLNEKSIALRMLYEKYPPFSIAYRFDNGLLKVSLRGNGEVDLTTLAAKYGGGGHKNSSGFVISASLPLPFVKALSTATGS